MSNDRSRGSLLDLASLLLALYFFATVLGRRDPIPPLPPSEAPPPATHGEKMQTDSGPLRNPLGPRNQWERLKEEKQNGRATP
jgi:hypothetical protein